jgi:hypothetical protein
MSKDLPGRKSAGSKEQDRSSHGTARQPSPGEEPHEDAAEATTGVASESTRTIEDLLRLVDEVQRKSADHDGKLRELRSLLAPRRPT